MSKNMKVLIAGGGIGGMAAAIALLKQGIDCEVYEQAGEMREIGAGIQISPNGNRALKTLGCFETLLALSCKSESKEIRLWNTGKTWKLFDLGDEAVRRYGFPYMTVFRPDLLGVLTDEAKRLKPDVLNLDSRAERMSQTDDGVTLELANRRQIQGDILLGADGVHTRMRASMFGEAPVIFTGMVAWRSLIEMDSLPERFRRSVAVNWIGPGGHVVHYPVQGGRKMNFVGTLEKSQWSGPPWNGTATKEECATAFKGWHEDIHTKISHSPFVTKWALCGRPFLDTWTKGRATLLGDACHPTLPFLAQGAVHTLEDAVVLARCLKQYADPTEALRRYDEARRPRAHRMVSGAAANTARFHNPDLAQPDTAEAFISKEWQSKAISDRYDWLFTYDAETAEI